MASIPTMIRYLNFSSEQQKRSPNPSEDYYMNSMGVLSKYFGEVKGINIFLGENNSGKSRFMREIMRDKNLRFLDIGKELDIIKSNILVLKQIIKDYNNYVSIDVGLLITFIVTNSYAFRNDTQISNIIGFENNGQGAVVIIDVKEFFKKLASLVDEVRIFISTPNRLINAFFNEEASIALGKISDLIVDARRIMKIFGEISSDGLLGERFGNDYIDGSYRAGFILNGAALIFDRYPWGDEYDEGMRNQFSIDAFGYMHNILQNLDPLEGIINNKISAIANPEWRTYIPTLRTARTLINQDGNRLQSNNDVFQHTTVHDYDLKESGVIVDTGFSLYDAIDTTRNARHEGRTSFKEFEQFLSVTFFNGKIVEVVAERVRNERGGNIIVSVEGVERDIHNLGDGIQSIIMLLYPLFTAPERAWFFIEEPELHLHPGFQRLFIETISANTVLRAKNLTIFLTTHFNHILDFALDDPNHVNIFTFRRREGIGNKSTYQIQLSSQRDIENLNVLGVRNSSVFLANCSIWVEGISDRLYFHSYLQAYLEHLAEREKDKQTVSLLEGLHYAFLEYAGGNISHFDFTTQLGAFTAQTLENIKALSVSNRIMLVADLDDGKNTRHEARKSQQHTGFQYVVLTVKEVENMLSPKLIVKGLKKLFRGRDFDSAALTQAEYRTRYLGIYLQEKYGGFPNSFLGGSGTIGSNYKRFFAEAIAPKIKWEEMGSAAQKFTEALYKFIMSHNPRLGSN